MSKYLSILLLVFFLLTGCNSDKDQEADIEQITLCKNVLPLESKFEIEGHFGCVISQPYKLTIIQEGSDIRYGSSFSEDKEMGYYPVEYDKFKRLWIACEKANIGSLKKRYGENQSTGDFHGKFTCEIQLEDRIVSKEIFLTYGKINDIHFGEIFDKIMEALPSDAHLPFYSIKTIDYSSLPIRAGFLLVGRKSNPPLYNYLNITQEGNKIDCWEVSIAQGNGEKYNKEITIDEFMSFWKKCSALDLVSLADSYGEIKTYEELKWNFLIELETKDGRFEKAIQFPNHEISDSKLNRLLKMLIELSDSKLGIPVKEE